METLETAISLLAMNATSERSFSALRRQKTYLRTTITQERLNSLMVLHVHKEHIDSLELEKLSEEFFWQGRQAKGVWFISVCDRLFCTLLDYARHSTITTRI